MFNLKYKSYSFLKETFYSPMSTLSSSSTTVVRGYEDLFKSQSVSAHGDVLVVEVAVNEERFKEKPNSRSNLTIKFVSKFINENLFI